MRKHLMKSCIAAMTMCMTATVLPACGGIEKSEAVTADVTAAQIEGRRAARRLIHTEWTDTTKLREEYERIRHLRDSIVPSHTAEFDSTFFSTLRIVEPTLAFAIEHGRL